LSVVRKVVTSVAHLAAQKAEVSVDHSVGTSVSWKADATVALTVVLLVPLSVAQLVVYLAGALVDQRAAWKVERWADCSADVLESLSAAQTAAEMVAQSAGKTAAL
jgi:hypothetical protein